MSRKAWKAARRLAREAGEQTLRRARAAAHLPKWRSFALALGIRGPARRWTAVWERRSAKALRVATKKTAHSVVGIAGREYHMRPGAPEAPKA